MADKYGREDVAVSPDDTGYLLFVYNFCQMFQSKGMREGIIHGVFFALLIGIFVDVSRYVVYPLLLSIVAKCFVSGLIEFFFMEPASR